MFRRQRMLVVTVLLIGLTNTGISGTPEPNLGSLGLGSRSQPPAALTLPNQSKLTTLQKAYLDTYSILSHVNSCSDFFGGPDAIHALNGLTRQLRTTTSEKSVVMLMKGETTNYTNLKEYSYRLFERAEINLRGPFYQGNTLPGQPLIPMIGRFQPNTREARAVALLHEVGHLVRGRDGNWLLPEDGSNADISAHNTARVIAACGEQIQLLRKIKVEAELAALHAPPTPELVAGNN